MNIHTRLVGAFDAIIMLLWGAVTIAMMMALLDPSFSRSELLSKRGTVAIQQLALNATTSVHQL
ncbi:hypothetical protein JM946_05610 [Steroidobacter sp. S1-65]|uniref:Uncharacterized protein n=1 Tax=Steroidobacter gossypii TaxID=2805490 RepID=A0ABS1WTB4_9GAMM|nr:hypothetical protein [Steroidobacter gossypii]MBM0104210.1 hypothetical protein [Steroidobacter gossypii]